MAGESAAQPPDEVYRSRVDLWLVALVVGGTAFGLALAMYSPSSRAGLGVGAGVVIQICTIAILVIAFTWVYRGTAYVLDGDSLFVRCGGLNWHIAYRDIKSVRPTLNPLSAPALSLHRLEIRYGKYAWVLMSPTDPDAFIASLKRRVPGLEVMT